MKETGTSVIDGHIYFIKLKTHIIGAYGQFRELKPYYISNGWKFKVSDLIKYDGTNVGPGCFFSLKQADVLLPLMEKDGWNIKEISMLVNEMKEQAEKLQEERKQEREEELENRKKEAEKWSSKIEFCFLNKDVFVVYGDETKIIDILGKRKLPKSKKSLSSLGKYIPGCMFGYILSYQQIFLFLDELERDWNVTNVREWATELGLNWKISNPEQEASKNLETIQDINDFFEWCYLNQSNLYAGTIDQKYNDLIGSWRFKHFVNKLTKFFSKAQNLAEGCKEWYALHKGSFERDMEPGNAKVPRARIIYTPMGGQKKK
jgi:hypothetical protein